MPTPILAAALCCAVVAALTAAWKRIGLRHGVDAHPKKRLAHELAGRRLLPPAKAVATSLVLAAFQSPFPLLVPLVSALTVLLLGVLVGRLIAFVSEVARVGEELVGLLAFGAAVCAWTWLLTPGRSGGARLLAIAGLACLLVAEWLFAHPLDLAVRCREIASTGLAPVLVRHPSYQVDQIDVLPDRDSVCVHYTGSGVCESLWVDLVRARPSDVMLGARHTEQVAAELWRVDGRAGACYLAIVTGQVVRLELDRGRSLDAEARRVVAALRPVPPRELAKLELAGQRRHRL